MASRKLTDADKRSILALYRRPEETTLTLASRYGVSSSTISRFLKSALPTDEYERLIQQKRAARTFAPDKDLAPPTVRATPTLESPKKRTRKRSAPSVEKIAFADDLLSAIEATDDEDAFDRADASQPARALEDLLGEDMYEEDLEDADLEEDLGEDLEEIEDEEFASFDEDEEERQGDRPQKSNLDANLDLVRVFPLAEALFPKVCYLVVDRTSELVAHPLKDFSDLGAIPKPESNQRTLPIFENHRVARRFATRAQRICKLPDAKVLLPKVSVHLQSKGITRLLLNGKVYALSALPN